MRILTRALVDRAGFVRGLFTSYELPSPELVAPSNEPRSNEPRATSPECRATSTEQRSLDGDNPVTPQIEGQLLVQPVDERRAVLVQEREEANRSFLCVAAGEGEGTRVNELTP